MIAQVVFDLPIDGPFDYLIPISLESQVAPGQRVQVLLGRKRRIGMVMALLPKSDFKNLKFIKTLVDETPLLDQGQMELGYQLSRYYGCSLGEALFTIVRGQVLSPPNLPAGRQVSSIGGPGLQKLDVRLKNSGMTSNKVLYQVSCGDYQPVLISLIKPLVHKNQRALILVPDQFVSLAIERMLAGLSKENYVIGTRSSVFRFLSDIALVIMVDEDNPSYKQEQTPMYETRDVLLMRAKNEHINVAFISTTPSVELICLVENGQVGAGHAPPVQGIIARPIQVIDLNNYKVSSRWFLSPAVLSALEHNLSKKSSSMLVVNHQLGLQQLQKTLQERFPLAKVCVFKRPVGVGSPHPLPLGGETPPLLKGNIFIGTSALLRFKHQTRVGLMALLDIDGELNRLEMRSCFRAWSLARHLRIMAESQFLIQTHQPDHYVIKSLMADDDKLFYSEDMRIRKELGLSPFGHQIAIWVRSILEKIAQKTAQEFYQALTKNNPNSQELNIQAPMPEVASNKRGQYRLNILMQGPEVIAMIAMIKQAINQIKRSGKVIITLNVDP